MRIDQKPFDDVRVRQAFRLIVDRQQMIDQALAGYGWLGNDMYAPFDPGYPKDLPQRQQDLEQAKSLLKQAGYDNNLTVQFTTSDAVGAGQVAAAQVFAGAGQGGRRHRPGQEGRPRRVLRRQLPRSGRSPRTTGARATTWPRPALHVAHGALQRVATGRTPSGRRSSTRRSRRSTRPSATSSSRAAEKIEYERGGFLVWQFNTLLDGYSNKLGGVIPDTWGQSACKNRYNLMYFV